MHRTIERITGPLMLLVWLTTSGCSSLGITLYPEGEFLTNQAADVLREAPRTAPLPRELSASVLPDHYLQPGDAVLLEPVELDAEARFPADQQVMADGTLDLGGHGRLVVAGLTIEDAELLIEQTLSSPDEDPVPVNLRLLETVHRYYVLGAVASPGSYPLEGYETVLDGILAAGGLASDAAPCKVLLARPTPPPSCRAVLPICYREIVQLGDTTTNYQLRPGDRIFVASRSCLDELLFWRAERTCPRCDCPQSACCNPELIGVGNPIGILPGPRSESAAMQSQETTTPGDQPAIENVPRTRRFTPPGPELIPESDAVPNQSPRPSIIQPAVPTLDGELQFDQEIPLIDQDNAADADTQR